MGERQRWIKTADRLAFFVIQCDSTLADKGDPRGASPRLEESDQNLLVKPGQGAGLCGLSFRKAGVLQHHLT